MKKILTVLLIFIIILSFGVTSYADTPALPEGNKLLNDKWAKYLGDVSVAESEVEGQKIYSITNFNKSFATPSINIYPSIKALMGDNDEITVWLVFDVRYEGDAGQEHPFGMKIRADGIGAGLKAEDDFLENYSDADTFEFNNGNIYASIASKGQFKVTNEWQRVEILKTFSAFDINNDFWTSWHVCFDYMGDFDKIGIFQIRNTGIFLEEEYESVKNEDIPKEDEGKDLPAVTPSPAVIYRPYGYDKYTATFAEVVDQKIPQEATQQPQETKDLTNNFTTVIIIAIIAVVVVAGTVITIIVIKKKKSVKRGEEK